MLTALHASHSSTNSFKSTNRALRFRGRQLFQNRGFEYFNALQASEDCLSTSKYVKNGNTTGVNHRLNLYVHSFTLSHSERLLAVNHPAACCWLNSQRWNRTCSR